MNGDRYTKLVLTVIAGALLWICALLSGIPIRAEQLAPAGAQLLEGRPQPVVVVGWGTVTQQGQVSVEWVKDQQSGLVHSRTELPVTVVQMPALPLPVTLSYTAQNPMPVGLTSVKPGPDWEPIRARVEQEMPRKTPGN